MSETKYITGVVIANGVPDSDDDVLNREDIKIISTKYRDRLTDVMHNRIKNEGVDVIHDWISEIDYTIDGKLVPSGSWLANFAVSNTEILKSIDEGLLNGLSLGSVSEDAMTRENWFINKRMTYSDLKSIEEVIPLFISFVDSPANGYGFEVMNYETFISKSKEHIGDDKMTNEEVIDKNDGVGLINALTSFVKELRIDKSAEDIDKEEAPESVDLATQLLAKLDEISSQQKEILEALKKEEETETEDVDEEIDKEEAEETEESEEESSEEEDEEDDETSEDEDKDDNIDKRQTEMPLNIDKFEPQPSIYKRTGRDELGRKIRK